LDVAARLASIPSKVEDFRLMNTPPQPTPFAEGEVIDGKYRVDGVLGVGGMGIVVAATHLHLDQRVALKFLLPAALVHADVVARFAREARAAVKIQSAHVAKVLDVGTLSTGAPYMVMEYLDGEDLEQLLLRVGPLSVQDAVDYVLQACEAVAEAHGYGIVHRDLKPANLFLATRANGRPIVKVLDFGISKSTLNKADASLTKTSVIMGSPLYMSPEQMASARHVDVRSDIWALGVILYEVLTQKLPFQADSMPELIVAVLHRAPESLKGARSDVPEGLESVVLRCLEKEPAARFANIPELATALAPYGRENANELVERISCSLDGRASAPSLASFAPASDPRMSGPTLALPSSFTVASWTQSGATSEPARPSARRQLRPVLLGTIGLLVSFCIAGAVALSRGGNARPVGFAQPASPTPVAADRPRARPPPATIAAGDTPAPPSTGQDAVGSAVVTPPVPGPASLPTIAPTRPPRPGSHPLVVARPPAAETHPVRPALRPSPPPQNPLDLKLQN
jgi:serine/threonine protein kinase